MARNATMEGTGYMNRCRYLLHDRDTKFWCEFRETLAAGGVKCIALPAPSPNLNSYAECWVRSVKEECLYRLILFGEHSLRRAVPNFLEHLHHERNHQGRGICSYSPPARMHLQLKQRRSLSRAARWLAQVLQPRRMNSLAIWESAADFRGT